MAVSRTGFSDATNTGVPAGPKLTRYIGDSVIITPMMLTSTGPANGTMKVFDGATQIGTAQVNNNLLKGGSFTIYADNSHGAGHDVLEFSKSDFDSFASVLSHASQVGQDVVISAGSDTLTLKNTKLSSLDSHDFHFA